MGFLYASGNRLVTTPKRYIGAPPMWPVTHEIAQQSDKKLIRVEKDSIVNSHGFLRSDGKVIILPSPYFSCLISPGGPVLGQSLYGQWYVGKKIIMNYGHSVVQFFIYFGISTHNIYKTLTLYFKSSKYKEGNHIIHELSTSQTLWSSTNYDVDYSQMPLTLSTYDSAIGFHITGLYSTETNGSLAELLLYNIIVNMSGLNYDFVLGRCNIIDDTINKVGYVY